MQPTTREYTVTNNAGRTSTWHLTAQRRAWLAELHPDWDISPDSDGCTADGQLERSYDLAAERPLSRC